MWFCCKIGKPVRSPSCQRASVYFNPPPVRLDGCWHWKGSSSAFPFRPSLEGSCCSSPSCFVLQTGLRVGRPEGDHGRDLCATPSSASQTTRQTDLRPESTERRPRTRWLRCLLHSLATKVVEPQAEAREGLWKKPRIGRRQYAPSRPHLLIDLG